MICPERDLESSYAIIYKLKRKGNKKRKSSINEELSFFIPLSFSQIYNSQQLFRSFC